MTHTHALIYTKIMSTVIHRPTFIHACTHTYIEIHSHTYKYSYIYNHIYKVHTGKGSL